MIRSAPDAAIVSNRRFAMRLVNSLAGPMLAFNETEQIRIDRPSRCVCVTSDLVKEAIPITGEIEHRHVENQQRIVN